MASQEKDFHFIQNEEQKHQDIEQIFGNPPSWMLKWGLTVLFIFVTAIIILSWIIKYPDTLHVELILTTEKPAINIHSRNSGKISMLLVSDQEKVKAGQPLIILENTANWSHIRILEASLQSLSQAIFPDELVKTNLYDTLKLGDIQDSYAALLQKFAKLKLYFFDGNISMKISALQKQIRYLDDLNRVLVEEKKLSTEEIQLARKDFQRNLLLQKSGAASDLDIEKSESYYLQTQRQYKGLEMQFYSNKISITKLEKEVVDLLDQKKETIALQVLMLKEEINRIKNRIENWKQNFLITSPINGKISMTEIFSEQQFIPAKQPILTVVPGNYNQKIIARATLASKGAGKVETNMPVIIKLDDFPHQEFGTLQALIKKVSLVPNDKGYHVQLEFPENELITSYNQPIPFRQNMTGQGEIITKDQRIFDRIFNQVLSIIRR